LVYNLGGALGTNLGSSIFYLVSSSLILIVVFYFIYSYRNILSVALPMASIAGGAIGNILDRVRLGKVVDFIDVDFFNMNLFGYQLDRWWLRSA
ncbi:MAG: lipoprotein signal peptidase, partial [Planctomycetes bacterium]|nr:lipoprotein signal peptidase [Planctomycetota bacterium]